eukprot:8380734-Alexandrium_andersonii.AAC.1
MEHTVSGPLAQPPLYGHQKRAAPVGRSGAPIRLWRLARSARRMAAMRRTLRRSTTRRRRVQPSCGATEGHPIRRAKGSSQGASTE